MPLRTSVAGRTRPRLPRMSVAINGQWISAPEDDRFEFEHLRALSYQEG